jgi:hypothetical protein
MLPVVPPIVIGASLRCPAHIFSSLSDPAAQTYAAPLPLFCARLVRHVSRIPAAAHACDSRFVIDDRINQHIGMNGGGKMSQQNVCLYFAIVCAINPY